MRTIEQLADAIDAVVATDSRLSFQLTMEELAAILGEAVGATSDIEITTLQQGQAELNERQQIAVNGWQAGGFKLVFSGQTTAELDYAASNSAITIALEALSNIGADNVEVTGGPLPGTPVVVEFVGDLAEINQLQMTAIETWQTNQARFDGLDLPDGALLILRAIDLRQILDHS